MALNPANFVRHINNPYFPLKPGTTFVYKSPDGSETVRTTVSHQTKVVLGVTCIVVQDRAFVDGKLVERTLDYYAQDKDGNVWYFGEAARNFENGHFLDTHGSWLAGVNGATPGIIMEGAPRLGDRYDQENAPGIAEDGAKIINLDAKANVPHGNFQHILVTAETNPLEPGFLERKYYAPGIGLVLAIDMRTGEEEELVNIIHRPSANAHKARGDIDGHHAREGATHAQHGARDADSFDFTGVRSAPKAAKSFAGDTMRGTHDDKGAGADHVGADYAHGALSGQDGFDAIGHGLGQSAHAQFFDL
jgi:hypothetical protein